jgi:hypothetical protein
MYNAEQIEISNLEPPEEITNIELEEIRSELINNVNNGVTDVLQPLTPRHHNLLLKLAFYDTFHLDVLEGDVREAMRLAQRGEPEAKRFNLKRYKAAVKDQKRKIAEAAALRARITEHNMHVIDGGKADPDLAKLNEQAPGDIELQAKLYSMSPHLKSVGTLEAKRKGRIWFDAFYNNFYTDYDGSKDDRVLPPRAVDDAFLLNCYTWLQMSDTKLATSCSLTSTETAVHQFANQDVRNEPLDWLRKLEWDNKPRLSTWLSTVYGVPQDDAGYYAAVGRCWLVSMVARIMAPGCKVDTMPVLIGPQGNRKSTSLSILGGKWYAAINTSVDKQQDFLMSLNGVVLAEIAELDAISRAADSRVKAMLSTSTDKFRPPYGRVVKEYPRTCVLAGSTNDMSWHKDDSGGRRYWPIMCEREIDTEWLKANRDQLFAEAKVMWDNGGSWHDVPDDAQRERLAQHHTINPWQDKVASWIASSELYTGADCDVVKVFPDPMENEASKRWGTVITIPRVLTECLQIPVERQHKGHANKVGQVLRAMGFVDTIIRGPAKRRMRGWVVTHLDDDQSGQKLLQLNDLEPE